jgi:hypothetical protein
MIEDIVEVMARAIAEASDEYPDLWRLYEKQAEIALAALTAAGFTIVPKEAEKHQIDAAYAHGFNEPTPHIPQYPRALCRLPECACTGAYLCDRAREAMEKRLCDTFSESMASRLR